jgi:hypothetical protein
MRSLAIFAMGSFIPAARAGAGLEKLRERLDCVPVIMPETIEITARKALDGANFAPADAQLMPQAMRWLESAGYKGLEILAEALEDTPVSSRSCELKVEYGLVDTGGISCVFLAPQLTRLVAEQGRLVLMQVRHGLCLLPFSVWANIGIGCPVDPSFALGGERSRNPYLEKIAKAEAEGVDVAPEVLHRLQRLC